MGMGEALANYKAAIGAIRRLTEPAPSGLGISARGITMSTVGLVPGIDKLAEEGIPVTLALSLHAPDDELRDELVPINTRWKVDEAIDAAHRYYEVTGRRVSIEYALIRDINDQAWRADLLGEKLAPAGVAGCTSTRSRSTRRRARSGRRRDVASSSSSSSGCGPTASPRRCATPAAPTSTVPAASSLRPRPEAVYAVRVRRRLPVLTAALALVLAGCGAGAELPAGLRSADGHATTHAAAAPSTSATATTAPDVPLRAGERFQSIRLPSALHPEGAHGEGHRRLPVLRASTPSSTPTSS